MMVVMSKSTRSRSLASSRDGALAKRGAVEPSRKEASHERIVKAAARAIRRAGFDGVGVADIMKEAGLTHGGFYAHFPSREALLVEAIDHAAAEGIAHLDKAARADKAKDGLSKFLDAYLSDEHTDSPETGCAVAALACETGRQAPEVRHAATRRIKEMIDMVEREMPGWGKAGRHEDALAVYASLVGAVAIARAVDDPELSKALRNATRALVKKIVG